MKLRRYISFQNFLSLMILTCSTEKQDADHQTSGFVAWRGGSCDGKMFRQIIKFGEGCKNVMIENKLCVGNCMTVYVPSQYNPIMTCRLCKPATNTTIEVTTLCESKEKVDDGDGTQLKRKKSLVPNMKAKSVLKVLSCKCDDCS